MMDKKLRHIAKRLAHALAAYQMHCEDLHHVEQRKYWRKQVDGLHEELERRCAEIGIEVIYVAGAELPWDEKQ